MKGCTDAAVIVCTTSTAIINSKYGITNSESLLFSLPCVATRSVLLDLGSGGPEVRSMCAVIYIWTLNLTGDSVGSPASGDAHLIRAPPLFTPPPNQIKWKCTSESVAAQPVPKRPTDLWLEFNFHSRGAYRFQRHHEVSTGDCEIIENC